jgi:hypothetical protein
MADLGEQEIIEDDVPSVHLISKKSKRDAQGFGKSRGGMCEHRCEDPPCSHRLSDVWRMRDPGERDASLSLRSARGNRLRTAIGWYPNHDLLHTGNQFGSQCGSALRDLMARMGHDSERAAMIYQHVARGADQLITNAIDAHVKGEQRIDDGDDGPAGILVPAG